jgi:hypothetical protein
MYPPTHRHTFTEEFFKNGNVGADPTSFFVLFFSTSLHRSNNKTYLLSVFFFSTSLPRFNNKPFARILRVLENVSNENEENCNYLLSYRFVLTFIFSSFVQKCYFLIKDKKHFDKRHFIRTINQCRSVSLSKKIQHTVVVHKISSVRYGIFPGNTLYIGEANMYINLAKMSYSFCCS